MRILLLTNKSPWPPKDGGASATMGMIDGLVSAGESVSVLAINTLKHHATLTDNAPSLVSSLKLVPLDTTIMPLKLVSNLLFSSYPYPLERFISTAFRKNIESEELGNYDLIQIEGLAMTAYLPELRRKFRGPIVYRPHNVECRIWELSARYESNPLKNGYLEILRSRTEKLERDIINRFDGIAAMSEPDLDWFKEAGLKIKSVVIQPVPYGLKCENREGDPNKIFFIGALDWRPNIDGLSWFLKKVWPLISSRLRDIEFHVAGRNPSKQIARVCQGRNIIFHGEVESASEFMSDKQIMVVPLFAGSGIRIKIIEGMSKGKCIVATPISAEGLRYSDRNNIHLAAREEDFAEAITRLMGDHSLRQRIALNAVENVRENYNIFASADRLMKFYNMLS